MFIQKLSAGFTRYFNERYDRSGVLFQGKFKARHITHEDDLLKMSAYVNLNNKVHQLSTRSTKLVRSSFKEYEHGVKGLCDTSLILKSFSSGKKYATFAQATVNDIIKYRKTDEYKEFKKEFYASYFE